MAENGRPQPERGVSRRTLLRTGAWAGTTAAVSGLGLGGLIGTATAAQAADPAAWRTYPYTLYDFTFPAVEGLTENQSDTWFAGGTLVGRTSGREYSFITIFCKNRIAGRLRADFYTFAVFDLDNGDYGSHTTIDFPPANLLLAPPKLSIATGHLELGADTPIGRATWSTRRDGSGALDPFRYRLGLRGKDASGRAMRLDADMDPQNRPAVLGGDETRGIITCFGQDGTGTYFQTAPLIRGTLHWGDVEEEVVGTLGHIDRQYFPQYAGVEAGLLARDRSHEWRSINLDDGTDLSIWRQFDRTRRNAPQPFTGATRYLPDGDRTVNASDVEVTYRSFVKWPSEVATFVPPPSPNRYLPGAHVLRVPEWDLELEAVPLVPAPAHGLPVEYMIGPMRYTGTMAGRPISGTGVFERTLAYYRAWELVDVVRVTVDNLPDSAFINGSPTPAELRDLVDEVGADIDGGRRIGAALVIEDKLRPAVARLAAAHRADLGQLLDDLTVAPG